MGTGSGDSHSGTHMHRESCRPAAGILPCSSRRPMRSSRRGVCHSRSCGCLGLPAAAKACCRLSLLGLLCLFRFLSCLGPTHTLWDCGRPGLQATVRTGQEFSHRRSRLQVSSWYRGGLVCCIRAWGWFSHRAPCFACGPPFSLQRGCILAENLVEQLLRQPLSDPCLEQGLLCLPCRSFRNVRDNRRTHAHRHVPFPHMHSGHVPFPRQGNTADAAMWAHVVHCSTHALQACGAGGAASCGWASAGGSGRGSVGWAFTAHASLANSS